MNIGPILHRELRRQARQWPTYWLRVVGGALVLAACAWGLTVTQGLMRQLPTFAGLPNPTNGRALFVGLNKLMGCLVWLIGPLLTADCLAREKRDGTLGLLFLTPLRATDVVIGKAVSHALRAFTVLLAAYPVLMLPILLGGVGWADAVRMFFLQLAVLGLALAAGVTASALSREWLRTRLLALVLTLVASAVFVVVYIGLWTGWHAYLAPAGAKMPGPNAALLRQAAEVDSFRGSFIWSMKTWVHQNLQQLSNPSGFWWGGGLPGNLVSVLQALVALVVCWTLVALAVRFAAVGLTRTWRRDTSPPPPGVLSRTADALTQERVGRKWLVGRRRALLELNPVAWLDGARWSARIGRWLWAGLAAVVLTIAWVGYPDASWAADSLRIALVPLVVAVGFSASASFRRERETGALELLLVTPLTPQRIFCGRLLGLWGTFGPAIGLLTVALLIGMAGRETREWGPLIMPTLRQQLLATWVSPLGVAVLGLGFGLRWAGFFGAWFRSLAAWYLIPYAAGMGLIAAAALSDWLLNTEYHPYAAFGSSFAVTTRWGFFPEEARLPTLIGPMAAAWWWPFMGLVAAARLGFLILAWRLGIRALSERLFLPKPRHGGVDES